MIKICVFTLFFCSFASRHFLIQTEGGNYSSQVPAGEDYREVQLPDYKVQEGCNICGLERDDGVTRLDYTDYIVGAQSHDVDKANKYPWIIDLRKTRNKGKSLFHSHSCGASLIASKESVQQYKIFPRKNCVDVFFNFCLVEHFLSMP